MILTKTDLLGRIQRGRKYTATQLANLLRTPRPVVLGMLHELAAEGRLQTTRTQARVVHFEHAAPDTQGSDPQDALPVQTSVATFRVNRTFEGRLSDYGSELDGQRRLALLTRDRNRNRQG